MLSAQLNQILKRRRPIQIPLRSLLVLPFVVQMVATASVVGYLSYRSGQKAVEQLAEQVLQDTSDRLVQTLNTYLQFAHQTNQANIAALRSGAIRLDNLDQLHRFLILQHQQDQNLTSRLFGTPQGHFRLIHRVGKDEFQTGYTYLQPGELPYEVGIATPANPGQVQIYSTDANGQIGRQLETTTNVDVRQRPWYQQAVLSGRPGWTQPFQIGASNQLTLSAYAPVYDAKHQLQGVFAANISLNRLSHFLQRLALGATGQVFIVERNGWLIANSIGEPPYRPAVPAYSGKVTTSGQGNFKRLTLGASANPLTRAIGQALQTSHLFEGGSRSKTAPTNTLQHFDYNGDRYFLWLTPYQEAHGLDWSIVTVVPASQFLQEIQTNAQRTLWLCSLTVLSSIVLGLWLARKIAKPIEEFDRKMREFAPATMHFASPPTYIQEVEALRQAMLQMTDRLAASFHSLKASEQKFAQLIKYLPIGVAVFDAAGKPILMNQKGGRLLGQISLDIPLQKLFDQICWYQVGSQQPYPQPALPLTQALRGELAETDAIEIEVNGDRRMLEIHAVPVLDGVGKVEFVIHTFNDITSRRQAETSQAIFNESTDALFVVDPATRLTVNCNQRAVELFEASHRQQLLGIEGNVLQLRQFTAAELEHISRELVQKGFWSLEVEYLTFRGNRFWGLLSVKPIAIANQTLYLVRVTDIRDRKRAEFALQAKTEELNRFFAVALDLLCIANSKGYFWRLNDQWEKTLGYSLAELEGSRFLTYVHPDDMEKTLAAIQILETNRELFNFVNRYRCQDGSYRWFEWRSVWVGQYIYAAARDITERKQSEAVLQRTTQQLRAFWDHAPVIISLFDQAGRYLQINPAFAALLQQPEANIIGRTFQDLFPQAVAQRLHHCLAQALNAQEAITVEIELPLADEQHYFQTSIFPIPAAPEDVPTFWAIATDITARRRSELERQDAATRLRESEARYRAIVEDQTELITRFQPDGTFTFVNDTFCRYFGLTKAQIIGTNCRPLLYLPDQASLDRHFAQLTPTQPVAVVEHRVVVNGTIRWMQWTTRAFYDESAQLVELKAVGSDVDDRKQLEIALQTSEANLATILDSARAAIIQVSIYPNGNIRYDYVSRQSEDVFGIVADAFFPDGQVWRSRVHAEDWEHIIQPQLTSMASSQMPQSWSEEYRFFRPDGSIAWILAKAISQWNETSGCWNVTVVDIDITTLKQAEQTVRQSEAKFATIFHQNPVPAWIATLDASYFLDVNQSFCEFLGYPAQELLWRTDKELNLWENSQDWYEFQQALKQSGTLVNFETVFRTHNGNTRTVLLAANVHDLNGQDCVLGVLSDISDRKQAEFELQESLLEKEVLLLEVYHRVKNNLQLIQSMLRRQQRRLHNTEAIQALQESWDRVMAISLVHDTLYQSNNLAQIDLADYIPAIVQQVAASYAEQAVAIAINTQIQSVIVPMKKAICCGLILNELLTNAFKYAFPDNVQGQIDVIVSWLETAPIPTVQIQLKDNGVGLPETIQLNHLQTLGLDLVQDFVTQLKGTLTIELNSGTQFLMTFPVKHRTPYD